ncbi:MAG TPA: amidohydrolase family protein, partial [Verrucomicrobiae bacterium]|nr:amidohydrolase family protein [Verrucomicrobiae bacterium]
DYTDMAGQIPPQKTFPDWIKAMLALKAAWSYSDFARSWANGAKMLLRSEVTTVLDVEAVPELLPDVWSVTPMRVISFREIISLRKTPQSEFQLAQAAAQWAGLHETTGRSGDRRYGATGLSPHAPYTTHTDLLRWASREAQRRDWLLTTHVAESQDEFDMFRHASGPMYEWLKTQRDMSDCGKVSPVQHLERCGYLSSGLLAVHANYLEKGDAELVADRGVHVVHCPRSHAYFGHAPFPYGSLAGLGVNICIGTDSLASVKKVPAEPLQLSLFAEMRAFASTHPAVPPETILRMVTINAARALGQATELGQLAPNTLADVIALEYKGSLADAPTVLLEPKPKLLATIINGIVH